MLAGASLGKIITCDNGTFSKKMIFPGIELSHYMKLRLNGGELTDWLDIFACCKKDMPEIYDSFRFWDEDWNDEGYSIWDDDLPIPKEFYKYLSLEKNIVKVKKEVKELKRKDEYNRLDGFVPNPNLKFALMFLYILEKYERGLEKEYFYFIKGFHSIVELDERNLLSIDLNNKEETLTISDMDNLMTGGKLDIELLIKKLKVDSYQYGIAEENKQNIKDWFIELMREYYLAEENELLKNIVYFWTSSNYISEREDYEIQIIDKADKDESLPTSHTCFNQLNLHKYSSKEILNTRLRTVAEYGTEGFGFA